MNKYIDGDFFESLSLNNENILYCTTDNVDKYINKKLDKHYKVLLTHNADRNVSIDMYNQFLNTNNFDYWFAQNCEITTNRLINLPIGLERKRWCNFLKTDIIENINKIDIKSTKILYGNFSINTSSLKRNICYNYFNNKEYFSNDIKYLVTSVHNLTIEEYTNYCINIKKHKFNLCPEGNGIDTHRFWETLYLGRVPVVLHNAVNDSFKNLPVLILNSWDEFEYKYKEFDYTKYNLEKLKTNYWKNLIVSKL